MTIDRLNSDKRSLEDLLVSIEEGKKISITEEGGTTIETEVVNRNFEEGAHRSNSDIMFELKPTGRKES